MNEENELIHLRRQKLSQWREEGQAYPNAFRPQNISAELVQQYDQLEKEELEQLAVRTKIAGRMMTRRIMGKASFAHLQDRSGQIQVYVQRDALEDGFYNEQFKKWDIGDIVGVTGTLFKTNKGELSVKAEEIELLAKAVLPLPEKFHGLADTEIAYRQRYLDLIMNERSRQVFKLRSRVLKLVREFFDSRDFQEVETPMMQPIPGGAVARPFITHHNALDIELFLRIAPELYLKRLVVGGFERVYELNRNFRNEGLSTRHNPEFTMLEFYQAYADFEDLMRLTEELMQFLVKETHAEKEVTYGTERIDFSVPFKRLRVSEAVLEFNSHISPADLNDRDALAQHAADLDIHYEADYGIGKLTIEIFEKTVESKLIQPTFITHYPVEVSPLSRVNDEDSNLTDRFELFIAGREIANGFSELNDPVDQAERFKAQVRAKDGGDLEAMHYDADYVRALEYGMPPTAGEGIGIDRLVMLLADVDSIKDVLLFPHLRPVS